MSHAVAMVSSVDQGVGTLRFNRPAKRNALTLEVFGSMADQLDEIGADEQGDGVALP